MAISVTNLNCRLVHGHGREKAFRSRRNQITEVAFNRIPLTAINIWPKDRGTRAVLDRRVYFVAWPGSGHLAPVLANFLNADPPPGSARRSSKITRCPLRKTQVAVSVKRFNLFDVFGAADTSRASEISKSSDWRNFQTGWSRNWHFFFLTVPLNAAENNCLTVDAKIYNFSNQKKFAITKQDPNIFSFLSKGILYTRKNGLQEPHSASNKGNKIVSPIIA